jgi:hypothetical protein
LRMDEDRGVRWLLRVGRAKPTKYNYRGYDEPASCQLPHSRS